MAPGLCNAPGTLQRLTQTAFREELFSILLCHLDVILVFSQTVAEHISRWTRCLPGWPSTSRSWRCGSVSPSGVRCDTSDIASAPIASPPTSIRRPRIDESMDALAGARYFTTLDLQSAYMQVPMHPGDAHKTAYTRPFGLFEDRRMAFGLCCAPDTFQRLTQTAFREELFSILLCYLDVVLVFSQTVAEHISRLDTVFTRLTEYGSKLALRECELFRSEVQYLGHRVCADSIATDPDKATAIQNRPTAEPVGLSWDLRRTIAGMCCGS